MENTAEKSKVKFETPVVELVTCTKDPFAVNLAAAKRCYSKLDNDELFARIDQDLADENGYDKSLGFLEDIMHSGHMSVLEHASFVFAAEGVSRAFLAQMTRSRIASFSVQSQRYVEMSKSISCIIPPSIIDLGPESVMRYAEQMETMHGWYCEWIDKGIPAEDARYVTTQGVTTKLIFTMNVRELIHLFSLRCCSRAQWEFRDVADQMLIICRDEYPEVFDKIGPPCYMTGRCPEGKRSCGKMGEMIAKFGGAKT